MSEINPQRVVLIREALTNTLNPTHLEVIDDSMAHYGHAGNQSGMGHFSLVISSPMFKGKTKIECHRLVYKALGSLMETDIHAVKIDIKE